MLQIRIMVFKTSRKITVPQIIQTTETGFSQQKRYNFLGRRLRWNLESHIETLRCSTNDSPRKAFRTIAETTVELILWGALFLSIMVKIVPNICKSKCFVKYGRCTLSRYAVLRVFHNVFASTRRHQHAYKTGISYARSHHWLCSPFLGIISFLESA